MTGENGTKAGNIQVLSLVNRKKESSCVFLLQAMHRYGLVCDDDHVLITVMCFAEKYLHRDRQSRRKFREKSV